MEIKQNEYKNLGEFKFWCQKVLPLVYDDSLSYYELLCKVTAYLNDTIENMNLVGDDMDKLYAAYTQLQEYVNTYFDNLDVQNEINSKLDLMSANGELSGLLLKIYNDTNELKFNDFESMLHFLAVGKKTYGRHDKACGLWVMTNNPLSNQIGLPAVLGASDESLATVYGDLDSVGAIFQAYGKPFLFETSNTQFTNNSVTVNENIDLTEVCVGMIVYVKDSGTDYLATITNVDIEAKTFYVAKWIIVDIGGSVKYGTPNSGAIAQFNKLTHTWGVDINMGVPKDGIGTGIEVLVGNQEGKNDGSSYIADFGCQGARYVSGVRVRPSGGHLYDGVTIVGADRYGINVLSSAINSLMLHSEFEGKTLFNLTAEGRYTVNKPYAQTVTGDLHISDVPLPMYIVTKTGANLYLPASTSSPMVIDVMLTPDCENVDIHRSIDSDNLWFENQPTGVFNREHIIIDKNYECKTIRCICTTSRWLIYNN